MSAPIGIEELLRAIHMALDNVPLLDIDPALLAYLAEAEELLREWVE